MPLRRTSQLTPQGRAARLPDDALAFKCLSVVAVAWEVVVLVLLQTSWSALPNYPRQLSSQERQQSSQLALSRHPIHPWAAWTMLMQASHAQSYLVPPRDDELGICSILESL